MNTQSFEKFDSNSFQRFSAPSVVEKDLKTLSGILRGIASDGEVSAVEHAQVVNWVNMHKDYEHKQPYKEILSVIKEALSDDVLTIEECNNILWFCDLYVKKSGFFGAIASGIQELTGLIKGITLDKVINHEELVYLDSWLEDNSHLKNTYPYDELCSLLTSVINEKNFTTEAHDELLRFCESFTCDDELATNGDFIASLKIGFCQIDPSISIAENTFCITGVSRKYKRQEIAEQIELYGGYVTNSVSGRLNYLVMCDEKNNCWAFSCYGRKVEEAIKHRKKGAGLIIVHENDLYDHFETIR